MGLTISMGLLYFIFQEAIVTLGILNVTLISHELQWLGLFYSHLALCRRFLPFFFYSTLAVWKRQQLLQPCDLVTRFNIYYSTGPKVLFSLPKFLLVNSSLSVYFQGGTLKLYFSPLFFASNPY